MGNIRIAKLPEINYTMKGIFSAALAILLLSFASCNKSDRDLDNSTGSSISSWTSMNHFHNIMREVHRVAQVDTVLNSSNPNDSLVPSNCMDSIRRTPDIGPFPIDLEIFYSETTTCPNQRNNSGKINASFDGYYSSLGTEINVSLDNYVSNNVAISGNIKMTVIKSVIDSLIFNVEIIDGSLLDMDKPAKNQSYFAANLIWNNSTGRKTGPTNDDDFVITGSGNGMAENGVIYTYVVENEMVLKPDCDYERFGSFRLSAPNTQDRICNVNEGNGCDNIFQVAIPPANGNQIVEIK